MISFYVAEDLVAAAGGNRHLEGRFLGVKALSAGCMFHDCDPESFILFKMIAILYFNFALRRFWG